MAGSGSQSLSEDGYVSLSSDSETEVDKMAQELLNFRSPRFNAMLSLKLVGNEREVPIKDAPKYLNLHQYEKASKDPKSAPAPLKKISVEDIGKKRKEAGESVERKGGVGGAQEFPMPGRRFLPHQMPVYRPRKEHPNTLTLMRDAQGPLSLLTKVMTEKKRVKVWTRNIDSIRGYCVGYVEAFDKHWNLALRDVDELFQRKRKLKYPAECLKMMEAGPSNSGRDQSIHAENVKLQQYIYKTEKKNKKMPEKVHSEERHSSGTAPVLLGGGDALKICRLGLEKLTLMDTVAVDDGIRRTDRKTTVSTNISEIPSSSATKEINPKPSHSTSGHCDSPSKSQIKKRGLTLFKSPHKDPFGFLVIGKSKKYEIVQRHVGQLFLMGNDVVFIEVL